MSSPAALKSGRAPNVRSSVAVRSARLLAAAVLVAAALACPAPSKVTAAWGAKRSNGPLGLANLKLPVPASARTHGTTSTATTAPPAANGAQPGTIAPGSKVSVPTTTAPTGATPNTATGTAGKPAAGTPPAPVTTAPAAGAAGKTPLAPVRRRQHKGHRRLSTTAIVLAAIGALLLLACLIWAAARWLALEPRWSTSTIYSLREASYHASATWAEFSDWARIGH